MPTSNYCCICFSSGEEVTSGEIKVHLKYGIIPIYSNTFDLCSKLPLAGAKCPLPKGVNILPIKETLPTIPTVSRFL